MKSAFIYKEPVDIEGFELLEKEYEGTEKTSKQDNEQNKTETINTKAKFPTIKQPLPVAEWNEQKAKEAMPLIPADFVDSSLSVNMETIKMLFNSPKNTDIVTREFTIGRSIKAFITYIDGMADRLIINDFILRQLMPPEHFKDFKAGCPIDYIMNNILSIHDIKKFKVRNTKLFLGIKNKNCSLYIHYCRRNCRFLWSCC